MKLSDIKGERTLEVVADLVDPIANIAKDKEAMKLFEKKTCPKGKTQKQFFIERVQASLPAMMKNHKQDIIKILSTIEGVSEEEYTDSLNLAKLISDCVELITDEEFLAFLSQNGTDQK